jgi:hypothetical protein
VHPTNSLLLRPSFYGTHWRRRRAVVTSPPGRTLFVVCGRRTFQRYVSHIINFKGTSHVVNELIIHVSHIFQRKVYFAFAFKFTAIFQAKLPLVRRQFFSPPFELRNSGVPAVARSFQLPISAWVLNSYSL